jgi:chemotaxis protein MotA
MKRADFNIPAGLLIGLVAIAGGAALEGIRLGFLFQPTAALIVFGGTLGAAVVMRGTRGVVSAGRAVLGLCVRQTSDEEEADVARLAWLSRAVQREGVRALDTHAANAKDPLVATALTLVTEYAPPESVRGALDRTLDYEDELGRRDAALIEAAGGYAPTFGILGAVLGLINVLRALNEPGALGTGIATAFVATLYGVGFANMVLFPVAARLRERHAAWMVRREALADALVTFSAHEPPGAIARSFAARASLGGDVAHAGQRVAEL